jgi:hypothetical protein
VISLLLLAAEQGVLHNGEEPSGFSNFMEIVSKPDNIPIVALLFIVIYFFTLSMRMARDNDRLTAKGEKQKIYDRMNRWVWGEAEDDVGGKG